MKKRLISTDFWSDGWVEKLDPIEKLLYIYIFSNDKCSWSGCTEISTKKMGYETGIDRDMVEKILKRFDEKGKIKYIDGYLLVKNFIRHHFSGYDSPDSRGKNNQIKAIQEEMKILPPNIIAEASQFIDGFIEIYKRLGSPLKATYKGIVPSTSTSTSTSTSNNSTPPKPQKPIPPQKDFIPPTLEQVKSYFIEQGYIAAAGEKAWKYYNSADWKDSKGNKVRSWKQKMQGVWFKDENKDKTKNWGLTEEQRLERLSALSTTTPGQKQK